MSSGTKYYESKGYEVYRVYTETELDSFIGGLQENGKYAVYSYFSDWGDMMHVIKERVQEWNAQNSGGGLRANIVMDTNAHFEDNCSPQHMVYLITLESY